jgi:hypothetical protein
MWLPIVSDFILFFTAIAQITNSNLKSNDHSLRWFSFGIGGTQDDLLGFNLNYNLLTKAHFYTIQYSYLEELKFQVFDYEPSDKRYEFNLTCGKNGTKGNIVSTGSFGLCYLYKSIYEVVGSYKTNPDDWLGLSTQYIWAKRDRTNFGVAFKGQILLVSKYIGIIPSFVANFTRDGMYLSLFLDLALGKLK